jgi:cysteinyl-tRNA synthetase
VIAHWLRDRDAAAKLDLRRQFSYTRHGAIVAAGRSKAKGGRAGGAGGGVELRLYNTMGRRVETFVPLKAGEVGMYCCGPTVYNYAHVGNLRTYVFEDVLRRTLERAGYRVRHVMNLTDVGHLTDDADDGEDKMEKGAREQGRTVWEIADFYAKAFFRDFGLLGCLMPHVVCKATDHIAEMIDLIRRLEAGGYTYEAGGNICFDISKFPGYGRLALLDGQELRAGARIAVDEGKRNPHDFVLWFTRSKFEHQSMLWDSPWGRGYPGWHVECSAMSMKYLGEQFDIHCGGIDAVKVHHTNEVAQTEAATGKPWVRTWMHGEHLQMGHEKMAKSSGNFVTLSTLLERGFDAFDYRCFLLGAHYRSQLAFGWDALEAARTGRRGLLDRVLQLKDESPDGAAEPGAAAAERLAAFEAFAADDLNMPRCLAELWALLRDAAIPAPQRLAAALRMDGILGLGLADARAEELRLDEQTQRLLEERERARKARDFVKADELRTLLKERGYDVQDGPEGTKVRAIGRGGRENPVTTGRQRCLE